MNEHFKGHSILSEKRIGPVKELGKHQSFRRKGILGRGEDQSKVISQKLREEKVCQWSFQGTWFWERA